jgi:hypothetical protein
LERDKPVLGQRQLERCDVLNCRGARIVHDSVLVGDDLKRAAQALEKLPRRQEMGWTGGSAEARIALGERLIEEEPARFDGRHECWEKRAPKIVRDHHGGEGAARKWPRAALEIGLDELNAGLLREIAHTPKVDIDGRDRVAECVKMTRMAPAAARHVEHRPA